MRRAAFIFGVLLLFSPLYGQAQDQEETTQPTAKSKKPAYEPVLPRNVLLPLKAVKDLFPVVTQVLDTGPDGGATSKPMATRMAVYASRDGVNKVTLTVDEYQYGSEASLAYEQSAQRAQLPDFEPIAIANVGQQVFAGAMKQGNETQIAIVALDDRLLVGATLSGFEYTTDNIAKLAELTRLQVAESHARATGRKR